MELRALTTDVKLGKVPRDSPSNAVSSYEFRGDAAAAGRPSECRLCASLSARRRARRHHLAVHAVVGDCALAELDMGHRSGAPIDPPAHVKLGLPPAGGRRSGKVSENIEKRSRRARKKKKIKRKRGDPVSTIHARRLDSRLAANRKSKSSAVPQTAVLL